MNGINVGESVLSRETSDSSVLVIGILAVFHDDVTDLAIHKHTIMAEGFDLQPTLLIWWQCIVVVKLESRMFVVAGVSHGTVLITATVTLDVQDAIFGTIKLRWFKIACN